MRGAGTTWTNESVRRFAEGRDPIEKVVEVARQATFAAMERGWFGPPFDPIELAAIRGIDVVQNEAINDARLIPIANGQLQIEFNPLRPKGRVRYSIAHEIAHTFFSDCADRVRNRDRKEEVSVDDWQLEILCNIAAAELIMPIGSFPDLGAVELSIDKLMGIRREYDVSTEALLLRFVRLTQRPCAMFSASRDESGSFSGRYRIDYVVPSRAWERPLISGGYLKDGTLLSECTAVGFTAKGIEQLAEGTTPVRIECVGVPPFPGAVFPRVLGIIGTPEADILTPTAILYVVGNALEPRGDGPRIIAHIVNDRSASWGSGFSRGVVSKYSRAQIEFRHWFSSGNQALGNTHFCGEPAGIEVASMIAQHGFGPSETPRIRYPALEKCLESLANRAKANGASVHMPRIGCGQAGGTWSVVGELISTHLVRNGIPVTVYDLPGKT